MTQSNAAQKFCLFCLIIVLVLAVNASAHVWTGSSTIGGTPAGDGTNWFDVDNWATDAGWYPVPVTIEQAASLPASSDMAMLFGNTSGTTATYGPAATDPSFNPGGPVVIDTPGAVASTLFIGVMEYQHATLNITSMGTLTVDTVSLGEGANYCVLNNHGTINVSGDFQFRGGGTKNGAATFNMNGGTVNIGGNIDMDHGSFGTMHLDGGTVTAAGLIFDPWFQDQLDITEGVLILDGNVTPPYPVTAYGGRGTVMYDYNTINPGKTTIWAAFPEPSPVNSATVVSITTDLEWFDSQDAVSYDVYFGDSQNDVADAQRLDGDINGDGPVNVSDLAVLASQWLTNPGSTNPSADIVLSNRVDLEDFAEMASDWQGTPDAEFKGNQTATTFDPGTLAPNTTYYWRIDEVNSGTTTPGTVWSFTTASGYRLAPEDFPILAWDGFGAPVTYDQPTFDDMHACGFNVAGFVPAQYFDIIANAGLKAFLLDWDCVANTPQLVGLSQSQINQRVASAVSSVSGHPALFGYFLRDEPPVEDFPGLANWVNAYRAVDPSHLVYISLGWPYAWSSYISTVNNDFLSYDFYGMLEDGSVSSNYYYNLGQARNASISSGKPFWNTVASIEMISDNPDWDSAPPTPENLRLQAYTSLAYGAKGIAWFTYFSSGIYWPAPVVNGVKTDAWEYLRNINMAIHQIGQTYMTLNNVGVYHGTSPSGWFISGSDLLVGDFDQIGTGQSFVMVVNKSLTNSRSYSVSESLPGSVYYVSPTDGQLYPLSGTLSLQPGEGRLLTVQ